MSKYRDRDAFWDELHAAQLGNREAFAKILRMFTKYLRKHILGTFHSHHFRFTEEDVEDSYHNVCEALLRYLNRYEGIGDYSAWYTYLRQTAHNRTLNYIRATRKHTTTSVDELTPDFGSDVEILGTLEGGPDREKKLRAQRFALWILAPSDSCLIAWRDYHNHPWSKIASACGTSVATVRRRYDRAKARCQGLALSYYRHFSLRQLGKVPNLLPPTRHECAVCLDLDPSKLAPRTKIRGEVFGDESMRLDGRIEGRVNLRPYDVTVLRTGRLEGLVTARKLSIFGEVRGHVVADTVAILDDGRLEGDIVAYRLIVQDGAHFLGTFEPIGLDRGTSRQDRQVRALPCWE